MSNKKLLVVVLAILFCFCHIVFADDTYEDSEKIVKLVQELLNEYGYNCGSPDGIVGSKTQDAIRQFEQDNDIPVTGTVSKDLVDSLISKGYSNGMPIDQFVERFNSTVDRLVSDQGIYLSKIKSSGEVLELDGPGEYKFSIEDGNVIGVTICYNNILSIDTDNLIYEPDAIFFALDPTLVDYYDAAKIYNLISEGMMTEENDEDDEYSTPCVTYVGISISITETIIYGASYDVNIEKNKVS